MTITDINDHSPVFEQSDPVRLTVVEHSQPPGSFLTDISATDADVGTNAHIRYSITAGDDNSKLVVWQKILKEHAVVPIVVQKVE